MFKFGNMWASIEQSMAPDYDIPSLIHNSLASLA